VPAPASFDYAILRVLPRVERQEFINAAVIAASAFPPDAAPDIFVCGPSGFVETATSLLVEAGHAPATIKTERFGPTGT